MGWPNLPNSYGGEISERLWDYQRFITKMVSTDPELWHQSIFAAGMCIWPCLSLALTSWHRSDWPELMSHLRILDDMIAYLQSTEKPVD